MTFSESTKNGSDFVLSKRHDKLPRFTTGTFAVPSLGFPKDVDS